MSYPGKLILKFLVVLVIFPSMAYLAAILSGLVLSWPLALLPKSSQAIGFTVFKVVTTVIGFLGALPSRGEFGPEMPLGLAIYQQLSRGKEPAHRDSANQAAPADGGRRGLRRYSVGRLAERLLGTHSGVTEDRSARSLRDPWRAMASTRAQICRWTPQA
jgi:hypothetical protein